MTVMVLARPKLLPHPGKGIGGCVRVTLRIEITTGSSVPDDHGTAGRKKNGPAVEKSSLFMSWYIGKRSDQRI